MVDAHAYSHILHSRHIVGNGGECESGITALGGIECVVEACTLWQFHGSIAMT